MWWSVRRMGHFTLYNAMTTIRYFWLFTAWSCILSSTCNHQWNIISQGRCLYLAFDQQLFLNYPYAIHAGSTCVLICIHWIKNTRNVCILIHIHYAYLVQIHWCIISGFIYVGASLWDSDMLMCNCWIQTVFLIEFRYVPCWWVIIEFRYVGVSLLDLDI